MWTDLRRQVLANFAECATPDGCVSTRAKPLITYRPIRTPRGNAVVSKELGSNVRRIVRFPKTERSGKGAA